MTELPPAARELLDAPEFATVATIQPDGQPQLSVVWATRDGDDVLFSTVAGRRKHKNLVRDPRASILIFPAGKPYQYIEVRGSVTMTTEGGRELIDALAKEYRGWDRYPADDGTDNVRVVVRITPERVVVHG